MISERCLMVRYPTRLLHSMLYNDKGATAHKVKNAYPAIYPFRHRPYPSLHHNTTISLLSPLTNLTKGNIIVCSQ